MHELAHEMLHKAERRTATTKTVRETEAEAVAFVVGKTIGLETGRASADYIHLYHGNAALLTESLEVIQNTSPSFSPQSKTPQQRQPKSRSRNWRKPANPDFDDADGPAPSAQLPRKPNRSKESNP